MVKCLEEGRKVDEEAYLVEIGKQAIFQKVGLTFFLGTECERQMREESEKLILILELLSTFFFFFFF